MQRERRSLWVIIIVLFLVGLFQIIGWQRYLGIGTWNVNRTIGWSWDLQSYIWWYVLMSPGVCALVSAIVYGILHYRRRQFPLWLMALQMIVLLLVSYYPLVGSTSLIVAWFMLISVVVRSKKAPAEAQREDILDDI